MALYGGITGVSSLGNINPQAGPDKIRIVLSPYINLRASESFFSLYGG
jgi:hypothetical protein